jgi:catechol 2,3-dioxygenase-like lactoylglutathione lyase family enzyme
VTDPAAAGSADAGPPAMRAREVLETCLYARDLAAAEAFYGDVLGLERIMAVPCRHVFFRCGERVFLVFNPDRTRAPGGELPAHGSEGPGHVCFAARDDELPAWREHLGRHGVRVEAEVAWPRGGRSLYFRDPAGNSIELGTPRIWGIDREPPPSRG